MRFTSIGGIRLSKRRNREKKQSLKAGRNPSVTEAVEKYLTAMYPYPYMPKILADELGMSYEAVKKACNNLCKQKRIARPMTIKRGWYMGIPTPENISALDDPPIKIHNLKLEVIVSQKIQKNLGNKVTVPPLSLYTQRELITAGAEHKRSNKSEKGDGFHQAVKYWTMNRTPYKVTFQFFSNSILIHIHATNNPLEQEAILQLHSWLMGVLDGMGVNTTITEVHPVWGEFNRDYEKVTITPNMFSIQDLTDGSILRFYRKLRNCHRLELGTTFEGDKELWDIFLNFGKPQSNRDRDKGIGGMFG